MSKTDSQYKEIIYLCRELFIKKTKDYGTAWRIMRLPTLTDQIFIKAQRIKTIQELKSQKIDDTIRDEFIGIINYCLIALMQEDLTGPLEIPLNKVIFWYDEESNKIKKLLENKNHDYGEAWRSMRISSMTDIILMKLYRIKQIEDNNGETIISEGVASGYQDIVNYAIFCIIKINENG